MIGFIFIGISSADATAAVYWTEMKPAILAVDDDPDVLKVVERTTNTTNISTRQMF